jgi:hypothetical protein
MCGTPRTARRSTRPARSSIEEAVATGRRTADAEEPRGAELREQHGKKNFEVEAALPAVQADRAGGFGNTDIYGRTYADPTP